MERARTDLAHHPALATNRHNASPPLEAGDDFTPLPASSDCPTELLGTFTLLMAGHGRRVSADLMLGDREYAMWQLARARILGDESLREMALRLFTYFAESRGGARGIGPRPKPREVLAP